MTCGLFVSERVLKKKKKKKKNQKKKKTVQVDVLARDALEWRHPSAR
jgi:hypothetical protein